VQEKRIPAHEKLLTAYQKPLDVQKNLFLVQETRLAIESGTEIPVMHTNLNLDENLVAEALRVTGLRTKKAVVEEGLRVLIRLHEQADVRRLRGMVQWEEPAAAAAAKKGRGKGSADPR